MKKFLSMVMAAAMVVSLVPATAFAASGDVKATAKVVDVENYADGKLKAKNTVGQDAEAQLYVTTADYSSKAAEATITLTLDNAFSKLKDEKGETTQGGNDGTIGTIGTVAVPVTIKTDDGTYTVGKNGYFNGTGGALTGLDNNRIQLKSIDVNDDKDEIEYVIAGQLQKGWTVSFDLTSKMDQISKGKTATVEVESDDITIANGDAAVYAAIEAEGIKASAKKTVDVAEEEVVTLENVKIEATVGEFGDFVKNGPKSKDELKLKLNSGFEFVLDKANTYIVSGATKTGFNTLTNVTVDDDEIIIPLKNQGGIDLTEDTWTIEGLKVEATSAKAGSTATLKVYLTGCDTVSVEVAKVVDYAVSMTVDEDEDVPVIYSGVNVDNDGITDDSNHKSLEVTMKETFAGAWNNGKDFTLSVPEGVYITDVKATVDNTTLTDGTAKAWFEAAYKEGNYVDLTFKRRGWTETDPSKTEKKIEVNFELTLVADPNFEGDVVLKLTGDAMEEQEVTIAKFVKPYTVEAQQNDMQIDYRNTEIPTSVVIKEAEAGLWEKDAKFVLSLDKINFDDEGTVTVDDKSGLELKDNKVKLDTTGENDAIYFTVDSRSDDEPAAVTISGMQLYMDRSLPAGAYDLELNVVGMNDKYENTVVLNGTKDKVDKHNRKVSDINDDFVSYTAKAGFVNIVTAGREDTDSFTTKVVVPVGESYLISGENKVEIPVPAYINAAGYTMLPLRAVAVALGINENNVLWDQTTRTATVMYGSKIINMTYGQKVVYVNAAPIPASTSVEIKENRMFLGLRDLGTALGVTDITWDGATKTATLNGNK